MIKLTRPGGGELAVNADLIERAEAVPGTVLVLAGGSTCSVAESVEEVIDKVRDFRASVLARAQELKASEAGRPPLLRALPARAR
jgi:flagellar protein FlbD